MFTGEHYTEGRNDGTVAVPERLLVMSPGRNRHEVDTDTDNERCGFFGR